MGGGKRLTGWLVYGVRWLRGFPLHCAREVGIGDDFPPATDAGGGGRCPRCRHAPDAGQQDADLRPTAVRRAASCSAHRVPGDRQRHYSRRTASSPAIRRRGPRITHRRVAEHLASTHERALRDVRAHAGRAPATRVRAPFDGTKGKGLKAPDSYAPDTDIHLQNNRSSTRTKRAFGCPKVLDGEDLQRCSDRASPRSWAAGPTRSSSGTRASTTTPIRRGRQHVDRPNRHTGRSTAVPPQGRRTIEVVRSTGEATHDVLALPQHRADGLPSLHPQARAVRRDRDGIDKISPTSGSSTCPRDLAVHRQNQFWIR